MAKAAVLEEVNGLLDDLRGAHDERMAPSHDQKIGHASGTRTVNADESVGRTGEKASGEWGTRPFTCNYAGFDLERT